MSGGQGAVDDKQVVAADAGVVHGISAAAYGNGGGLIFDQVLVEIQIVADVWLCWTRETSRNGFCGQRDVELAEVAGYFPAVEW